MAYNKDLEIKVEGGELAGTSLDDIAKRLIANMSIIDLLGALSNGYHDKYGAQEDAPTEADRAWTEAIDLLHHFDTQRGLGAEDMPHTNALSLIRRLWLENLIDVKEGAALKDRFNAHVQDALGTTLEEEQVQALYELLNNFNIGEELADIRGVAKSDLKPVMR